MPTAYVKAPISGTITGKANYCICPCETCSGCGNDHAECQGWSSPIDVGGDGPNIFLYVNYPTVRSVRTYVEYECCCNELNDHGRTITVELYAEPNLECYIGAVMFGHIADPAVGNGQTYNLTSSSLKLGEVVQDDYEECGGGIVCYDGEHVHMEMSGGQEVAPCCCTSVSAGSDSIYKWDFSACPSSITPSE